MYVTWKGVMYLKFICTITHQTRHIIMIYNWIWICIFYSVLSVFITKRYNGFSKHITPNENQIILGFCSFLFFYCFVLFVLFVYFFLHIAILLGWYTEVYTLLILTILHLFFSFILRVAIVLFDSYEISFSFWWDKTWFGFGEGGGV